jgi:hypothetical protein
MDVRTVHAICNTLVSEIANDLLTYIGNRIGSTTTLGHRRTDSGDKKSLTIINNVNDVMEINIPFSVACKHDQSPSRDRTVHVLLYAHYINSRAWVVKNRLLITHKNVRDLVNDLNMGIGSKFVAIQDPNYQIKYYSNKTKDGDMVYNDRNDDANHLPIPTSSMFPSTTGV